MLAWIDYRIPKFLDAGSVVLFLVLSALAFLVSPLSKVEPRPQKLLLALLPPGILVLWIVHQFQHVSVADNFTWMTNSNIYLAFGAAFSFSLVRTRSLLWRIEGAVFLLLYCLAIALRDQLSLGMNTS